MVNWKVDHSIYWLFKIQSETKNIIYRLSRMIENAELILVFNLKACKQNIPEPHRVISEKVILMAW